MERNLFERGGDAKRDGNASEAAALPQVFRVCFPISVIVIGVPSQVNPAPRAGAEAALLYPAVERAAGWTKTSVPAA